MPPPKPLPMSPSKPLPMPPPKRLPDPPPEPLPDPPPKPPSPPLMANSWRFLPIGSNLVLLVLAAESALVPPIAFGTREGSRQLSVSVGPHHTGDTVAAMANRRDIENVLKDLDDPNVCESLRAMPVCEACGWSWPEARWRMAHRGYKPYRAEDGPARCVTFCDPRCANMHYCPTIPAMKTYQWEHGSKELDTCG